MNLMDNFKDFTNHSVKDTAEITVLSALTATKPYNALFSADIFNKILCASAIIYCVIW